MCKWRLLPWKGWEGSIGHCMIKGTSDSLLSWIRTGKPRQWRGDGVLITSPNIITVGKAEFPLGTDPVILQNLQHQHSDQTALAESP